MFTHHLHTSIEIDAPARQVWEVLVDFAAYPQWNPFVRSVQGVPEKGRRLSVLLQPSGARAMRFTPVVLTAEPARELRWLGRLLLPGLFDGEHAFVIESIDSARVRFRQDEKFSGLLVGAFRSNLELRTKTAFEEMNRALKARVEERAA